MEVSASNALVECANRCARAAERYPGGRSYSDNIALGCSAFSLQAPNLCTLYTRCDESTRQSASVITWNYRIKPNHGPFWYSGTPSQRCETDYEDLAFGASSVNGPVYKDTAANPLQHCMDLCTAHSVRATKAGVQNKACGGFSVSDNGACHLHGPCKVKPGGTAYADGSAASNVVVDRTVQDSFKFYGPSPNPLNKVVLKFPALATPSHHNAAWGRAVDEFCALEHGLGWRAATTAEAKAYKQYGSERDRRWKDTFAWFQQGQLRSLANTASENYAVCFRPPIPRRYYQLPSFVSVYTRIPRMNFACSATPLLSHSGTVGDDPTSNDDSKDLLQRCADACGAHHKGQAGMADSGASPKSSGCVGFTVSTAGHCDLHVQCSDASLHYVAPEFNLMRFSFSLEAMHIV